MSKVLIEDFEHDPIRQTICSESGNGKMKRLQVIVDMPKNRVWYELFDHNTRVFAGPSLKDGISFYNNI